MSDATAGDVIAALERRYNPPSRPREWGTFCEVTDKAQQRRVDFLAVNLWVNRGRMMHGVEVKVQRADWMKELRSPKADVWYGLVDHWFLAAPQGVAQLDEIPESWGYLELLRTKDSWKLIEKKKAPVIEHAPETPWWLAQRLLTRVEDARKAPPVTPEALREARAEGSREGYAAAESMTAHRLESGQQAINELRQLRAAVGHRPIQQVQHAIAVLDAGRLESEAMTTARRFRRAADEIEAAIKGMPAPDDPIAF